MQYQDKENDNIESEKKYLTCDEEVISITDELKVLYDRIVFVQESAIACLKHQESVREKLIYCEDDLAAGHLSEEIELLDQKLADWQHYQTKLRIQIQDLSQQCLRQLERNQ